jgi:hypothetical protein
MLEEVFAGLFQTSPDVFNLFITPAILELIFAIHLAGAKQIEQAGRN